MKDHVVRDGECLSSIAHDHGFFWETLWNLPENAKLKELRKEPTVLLAGDVVHIPDLRQKAHPCATEATHRFRRKGVPGLLRLRMTKPDDTEDAEESSEPPDTEAAEVEYEDPRPGKPKPDVPWKDAPFTLDVDGDVRKGRTDGDGKIEVSVPPDARQALLTMEPGTPRERRYPIDLGRLDPVSSISGAADRLNNLGFGDGSRPAEPTPEFEEALSGFQRDRGLQVSGRLDAATQDELRKAHGS